MKKKKKKLDIKQFALEHVEKAVLVGAVLIFFGFVYSFFGHPSLPAGKGPTELASKADEAVKHMGLATWDAQRATTAGIAVTDYVKKSKRDMLTAEDYLLPVPFDRPIKESKRRRSQPKLFAVEQLRVSTGLGPFSIVPAAAVPEVVAKKDAKKRPGASEPPAAAPPRAAAAAQGNGSLEGRHWVMITGLVPMKKQVAAFDESFKDTIPVDAGPVGSDKMRDLVPQYRKLTLERAEVVNGEEGNFEPMDLLPTAKFIKRWSGRAAEVVSLDYVDPFYTMPLGPRQDGAWGEDAAHPKEVPLATEEELERDKVQEQENEELKKEMDLANKENPFGAAEDAASRGPRRNDRTPARNSPDSRNPDGKQKTTLEYRLFRFTDFTVEPGKTYRYRVKLAVKNPNWQLLEKFLKADVDKKSEFLETPVSAASPTATVGTGEGVLVAAPKPTKGLGEIMANLTVFTIEPETGLKTSTEMSVSRGTVVNLDKEVELPVVGSKEVTFNTNNLVLDIRGGKPLPGRDKSQLEPSEVLLWNANTKKLEARNELDDVEAIKELELPSPTSAKNPFGQRGMTMSSPDDLATRGGPQPTGKKKAGKGSILDNPVSGPPATGKTSAKKPAKPTP